MNSNLSEYDGRQFTLMLRSIAEYEDGETGLAGLGNLVLNLEALQSALEGQSPSFHETFGSLWGKLEDTYAEMLYMERRTPNEVDKRILTEAISELKALISSKLESAEPSSDEIKDVS
jgi:hypothetical protein